MTTTKHSRPVMRPRQLMRLMLSLTALLPELVREQGPVLALVLVLVPKPLVLVLVPKPLVPVSVLVLVLVPKPLGLVPRMLMRMRMRMLVLVLVLVLMRMRVRMLVQM